MKGQLTISLAVLIAGATLVANAVAAYYIPQIKIAIIEERQKNQYDEIQKQYAQIQDQLKQINERLNKK